MNDSGGIAILGVIVGALLVGVFVFFLFGDRMGLGPAGTSVHVEAPKVPVTK